MNKKTVRRRKKKSERSNLALGVCLFSGRSWLCSNTFGNKKLTQQDHLQQRLWCCNNSSFIITSGNGLSTDRDLKAQEIYKASVIICSEKYKQYKDSAEDSDSGADRHKWNLKKKCMHLNISYCHHHISIIKNRIVVKMLCQYNLKIDKSAPGSHNKVFDMWHFYLVIYFFLLI